MKLKHAILALLAVISVGCAREVMDVDVPMAEGIPLSIDGSIAQVQTRANAGGFEDGDAIGLYAVNYTENNTVAGTLAASGNQADNVKYSFDGTELKWTAVRPAYFKDANTHADLYVYYPYQRNVGDVEAYNFEVAKDQSKLKADGILGGYESSDLLWCKVSDVTPTEQKVSVRLEHRMAGVSVELTEGTGFGTDEFESLGKSVILLSTSRKATVNFINGTVSCVGGPQADGIVMCPQADGSWRAVVVPQVVPGTENLFAITIDGQTYRFKQQGGVTYSAGRMSSFTISINKTSPSGDYEFNLINSTITDWTQDANTHAGEARQYYVVNVVTPGTLGETITNAGKNPDRIRNLKVTGTVNADDFYFMRDHMAILEAVNMKECRVVDVLVYSNIERLNQNGEYGMWPEEYLDDVIPADAFKNKTTLVHFVFPETVKQIIGDAFTNTTLSGALVLPNDLLFVSGFAYTKISSIQFPSSLKVINGGAFSNCSTLTGEIILPSGLKRIGPSAFYFDSGLSGRLDLPSSLEYLGRQAFYCSGGFVGDLVIPDRITELYGYTFSGASFSGCLNLNNLTTLNGADFSGCSFVGTLNIPEGIIEIPGSCFSGNRFTDIKFPSTLKVIRNYAFNNNSSISEQLEFPDGIVAIEAAAFYECPTLPGVHFPSSLASIGGSAFYNCYGLSSIICDASEPPVITTYTFEGVGKDNFTVEVPEASLVTYQTETGWSEFKRFASYQNFGISRRIARALNDGKSKTYTLRCPSGMAWSVNEKPDWITVSPSSGTGKTEVTVTFSNMARTNETFTREEWNGTQFVSSGTYKGRAGEVVFMLNAKGNISTMRVEQFDYDWCDGDVKTVQTHSVGNGINIVLTGDGYDAMDIADGTMLSDMDEAVEHFFDLEPYHTYRDRFNVYYVFAESDERGIGTLNTVKDTKFGSYIGENRMVAPDTEEIFTYALKSPVTASNLNEALVIMIDNTSLYEGVTYMYGDGSAIACCPKSSLAYPYDFRGIVQHEAGGHGFGKLGDEYIYHNAFISTCQCYCCDHGKVFYTMKARGWFRNLEFTGNMYDVAWSHLIFNPNYSNKVDVYEGGYMHSRGVFRSEASSCMNNNIPYYSAISRQAMVERILELSGEGFTMQKFYDNDSFRVGTISRASKRTPNKDELNCEVHYSHDHGPVYMGEHPVLR